MSITREVVATGVSVDRRNQWFASCGDYCLCSSEGADIEIRRMYGVHSRRQRAKMINCVEVKLGLVPG